MRSAIFCSRSPISPATPRWILKSAIRGANAKFARRFGFIERELANQGLTLDEATLDEMDELWNAAKSVEGSESAGSLNDI